MSEGSVGLLQGKRLVGRPVIFGVCAVVAVVSAWATTWYLALVTEWDKPRIGTTWFEWRLGTIAFVVFVVSGAGMCVVRYPRRVSAGSSAAKWLPRLSVVFGVLGVIGGLIPFLFVDAFGFAYLAVFLGLVGITNCVSPSAARDRYAVGGIVLGAAGCTIFVLLTLLWIVLTTPGSPTPFY